MSSMEFFLIKVGAPSGARLSLHIKRNYRTTGSAALEDSCCRMPVLVLFTFCLPSKVWCLMSTGYLNLENVVPDRLALNDQHSTSPLTSVYSCDINQPSRFACTMVRWLSSATKSMPLLTNLGYIWGLAEQRPCPAPMGVTMC